MCFHAIRAALSTVFDLCLGHLPPRSCDRTRDRTPACLGCSPVPYCLSYRRVNLRARSPAALAEKMPAPSGSAPHFRLRPENVAFRELDDSGDECRYLTRIKYAFVDLSGSL
jgi:hypothetical protein